MKISNFTTKSDVHQFINQFLNKTTKYQPILKENNQFIWFQHITAQIYPIF